MVCLFQKCIIYPSGQKWKNLLVILKGKIGKAWEGFAGLLCFLPTCQLSYSWMVYVMGLSVCTTNPLVSSFSQFHFLLCSQFPAILDLQPAQDAYKPNVESISCWCDWLQHWCFFFPQPSPESSFRSYRHLICWRLLQNFCWTLLKPRTPSSV